MAKAARAGSGADGGTAGRVANRRKPAFRSPGARTAKTPPPRTGKGKARGGKSEGGGALARGFKLVVLMLGMVLAGFAIVLVVDGGVALLGKMELGQTPVAEIWAKVKDRFLDNDVPRQAPEPERPAPRRAAAPPRPRTPPPAPASARAPLPAPAPAAYAHDVEPVQADPQVEEARRRLDEILGRVSP